MGFVLPPGGLSQGVPTDQLLEVIDAVLQCLWTWAEEEDQRLGQWAVDVPNAQGELVRLGEILREAGSGYELDLAGRCLRRRVDLTVSRAAEQVMQQAPDPRQHLGAAWSAAYGVHPDPVKAYDEAVRAVEGAAIRVVLPNDAQGTLGKVIAHLGRAGRKWELAIEGPNAGDIGPLVGVLRLLWQGHVGRHAGGPTARRQRQDEAEMAVHLAATLVHWFTSGAVRQRATTP
jgi:hypothetical protein